mmetsp:Transcript_23717/g.66605  ORF Transcript_23717/g.66605 Transcript_23717/m.66605 type:complete len:214 (-) Transcript_23717:402-1043(-)
MGRGERPAGGARELLQVLRLQLLPLRHDRLREAGEGHLAALPPLLVLRHGRAPGGDVRRRPGAGRGARALRGKPDAGPPLSHPGLPRREKRGPHPPLRGVVAPLHAHPPARRLAAPYREPRGAAPDLRRPGGHLGSHEVAAHLRHLRSLLRARELHRVAQPSERRLVGGALRDHRSLARLPADHLEPDAAPAHQREEHDGRLRQLRGGDHHRD